MKRTPLRKVSAKQAKINRTRSTIRKQLESLRGQLCQAHTPECQHWYSDMHEIVPRGRGGSATDPDNILLVCRGCHRWIHDHPVEAKERGLTK